MKAHHTRCENWEYKTHPEIDNLRIRSEKLVAAIRRRPRLARRHGFDTRPAHRFLFNGFAPKQCPHYAGSYRGSRVCKFLQRYRVQLRGDPLVGIPYPPEKVEGAMEDLEKRLVQLEREFEHWRAAQGQKPDEATAVARLLVNVCYALERFLTIHPFANGNGHVGRLLAWAVFARQGFYPLGLPLDERPPYDDALFQHRRGVTLPLQVVMIQALKGYPEQSDP